jgi:hypothetical protein
MKELLTLPIYQHINDNTIEQIEFDMEMFYLTGIKPSLTQMEEKFVNQGTSFAHRKNIATFHGLPKIHKTTEFDKLTFRPIVATRPNILQSKISTIINERIKGNTKSYPTILENTMDLIQKLKNFNESYNCQDYTLLTFDFDSLYNNIPLEDMYNTFKNSNLKDSVKFIQFICNNNLFEYGKETFRQVDGIAMGTNVAPTIANLYLAMKYDSNINNLELVKLFARFIDDVFMIIKTTNQQEILEFINTLRELLHPLTFTWKASQQSIDFLDITIFKKNGQLSTKIYQKPINKYLYLPYASNHPRHMLTGFIKGEITRYKRYCSNRIDFLTMQHLFITRLINRGYPKRFLKFATTGFKRKPHPEPRKPTIYLTMRYSNNQRFDRYVRNLLSKFNTSFKQFEFRLVQTMSPNLKKIIMKSALTNEQLSLLNQGSNINDITTEPTTTTRLNLINLPN